MYIYIYIYTHTVYIYIYIHIIRQSQFAYYTHNLCMMQTHKHDMLSCRSAELGVCACVCVCVICGMAVLGITMYALCVSRLTSQYTKHQNTCHECSSRQANNMAEVCSGLEGDQLG